MEIPNPMDNISPIQRRRLIRVSPLERCASVSCIGSCKVHSLLSISLCDDQSRMLNISINNAWPIPLSRGGLNIVCFRRRPIMPSLRDSGSRILGCQKGCLNVLATNLFYFFHSDSFWHRPLLSGKLRYAFKHLPLSFVPTFHR